jgi:hypothetical protein
MATEATTTKGLTLPCPRCGEPSAIIDVRLADVSVCTCQECSEEFGTGEVRTLIEKWGRVLAWLDAVPAE